MTTVSPYYSRDGITIYHGSCAEIIGALDVSVVITDPPYGIGTWSSSGGNSISSDEAKAINGWDAVPPPELLKSVVAKAKRSIVWGGNYVCGALGPWRTPLVWDKAIRGMHFADGEIAWTNFDNGSLRIFNLPAAASDARGARSHPTQKPVALMRWCILQAACEGTILDPFMGSGTTLLAAKLDGRNAIGIDVNERYCEIAARRLSQGIFSFE